MGLLASPRARRAARGVAVVVFLAFLGYAVSRQWDDIRSAAGTLSPWAVALSMVPAVAAIFCSMLSWRAVLTDLGSPLPIRVALRIFFLGQLGKYVPGTVWPLLVQMELGRDHEVPRSRTAATGVVAVALGVTSALVVVAVTLPFMGDSGRYVVALAVLPFAVVALHPRVLVPAINRGLRLIRRQPLDRPLTVPGVLRGVGWAGACWLLIGVQVLVIARDLGPDASGLRLYAICVGSYALGWAAGFLVFIAPAGAGAREAALAVILGSILPTGAATLLALMCRLVLTLTDVVWAAVAAAGSRGTMAALRVDRARTAPPEQG